MQMRMDQKNVEKEITKKIGAPEMKDSKKLLESVEDKENIKIRVQKESRKSWEGQHWSKYTPIN